MQDQSDQILLAVPEAQLQIHSKYILLLFDLSPRGKSISLETIPTLNAQQSAINKKISLIDSQLVFQILQDQLTVTLLNIRTNKQILKFEVKTLSTLITIQSILKQRLCEIGFEKLYSFIKKIGQGGSAQVHLIQRISDSKLFAAKIISISKASEQCYEAFINETKLLRNTNHRFIIHLEGVYYSKKHLYQVLQYLEGGTLLNQLRNNLIRTSTERWRVIYHVTMAVEHLRQKMIAHRDIKLQNILVRITKDKTKEYVLSDFGLSSWIGERKPLYERCGTPGYIAPEVLKTQRGVLVLSHLSDVFSLGIIFHFVLTGTSVFQFDGNVKNLLKQNKAFKFDMARNKRYDSLSFSQFKILQMTLNQNPQKRITSAELLTKYILPNQHVSEIMRIPKIQSIETRRNQTPSSVSLDKKTQSKEMKQKFSHKSLSKNLSKINQSNFKKPVIQQKKQKEAGFFGTILQKLHLTQRKSVLRTKKKNYTARRLQLTQFIE